MQAQVLASLLIKIGHHILFSIIFRLAKQCNFTANKYRKSIHLVSGTGIQTLDQQTPPTAIRPGLLASLLLQMQTRFQNFCIFESFIF